MSSQSNDKAYLVLISQIFDLHILIASLFRLSSFIILSSWLTPKPRFASVVLTVFGWIIDYYRVFVIWSQFYRPTTPKRFLFVMKLPILHHNYIMGDKFLLSFGFIQSKNSKTRKILQRHMLLQSFVIIWIIEHPINNTVLVNKFSDLFLLEYELKYFLKFCISLWINTMDINKKMLAFEISSS